MKRILLTGATGYIGGRLLSRLQQQDLETVCFTRRPEALEHRINKKTFFVRGDVQNQKDLTQAMMGIDTAYYLIHSMGASECFEQADRQAATNFALAARACHLKRIIYVGGLGDSSEQLSSHLKSRQEVGEILKTSGAQVLEFRASIVIGSGSLSYELVRALVDRLPILIMPKWVQVPAQPIWINDLLDYLVAALSVNIEGNQVFEVGGSSIVSYRGIMEEYARQRGLRRLMINVPVLTPYLSSLWLGLVTPVFARTGRKLVGSLKHPTIVQDEFAKKLFGIKTVDHKKAIEMSIKNEDQEFAETRWADALSSKGHRPVYGGVRFGRRIVDSRKIEVKCTAAQAFSIISSLGGENGWKYANWIWKVRGFIDLTVGGVGIRRGRKHPKQLNRGDTLDWWRVEQIIPNQLLLLIAEMKVPGRAWLKFEIDTSLTDGHTKTFITQSALFDPRGLRGQIYWYGLYPVHVLIFSGMLREIANECQHCPEKASERV